MDHIRALHSLGVPVIAIKATFEVSVTFGLEEVVVLALLCQKMHVIVLAIVANLFDHSASSRLVFADKLSVLMLFTFQDFDKLSLFGKSMFKFRNTSSCFIINFQLT